MANNSTHIAGFISNSSPICFLSLPDINPYNSTRPDAVNPTWTFLAAVNGLFALPTAGVNALIVWTVFSDEDLRSSPFNFLLGWLAVTDMLVGLVVQPIISVVLGCLINYCYSPCKFTVYMVSNFTCSGLTVVSLALACVERYLSIEHPNLYNRIVTKERVQKVAVISWISTLVYLIGLTFILHKSSFSKVLFMLIISICSVIILFCCTKVQLTAYRQRRAIDIQQQAASAVQPDESEEQRRRRRELKQIFTMTILVIMSTLFIAPLIIMMLLMTTNRDVQTSDIKYLGPPICLTFLHLQSLVNPAIFTLRLSYIRNGVKNKLRFLTSFLHSGTN